MKLEQTDNSPPIAFSTYLGGSYSDSGESIAVDNSGNVYVAGSTTSLDFDMLHAIKGHSFGVDAFVFKLNQTGNIPSPAYSTYLGGNGIDRLYDIAVDSAGNAYVTGCTDSSDFDLVNEIEGKTTGGKNDIFVSKLEHDGNNLSLAFST